MNKFYKKYKLKPVINVAGTMTSIGASIINKRSLNSVGKFIINLFTLTNYKN